jgi:hypothetical protein
VQPKRIPRYLSLQKLHKLLGDTGFHVSVRTLRRWCALKKLPAVRKRCLIQTVTTATASHGGRYDWVVDLRELKISATDEGRELYEELVNFVNEGRL